MMRIIQDLVDFWYNQTSKKQSSASKENGKHYNGRKFFTHFST